MPIIQKTTVVPHSPKQMFDLVNAIEDYPKFLPWCGNSEIISKNEDEIVATLHLDVSGVKKSFTTRNLLQPHKMIELRLMDGPFDHLEGFWRFKPQEDGKCNVCLDLEFEFSNRLLGMVVGPVFQKIAETLVGAFQKRALEIYGN